MLSALASEEADDLVSEYRSEIPTCNKPESHPTPFHHPGAHSEEQPLTQMPQNSSEPSKG